MRSSRERLHQSLNHREPDRIPLDLGGIVSGITRLSHRSLLKYLGFQEEDEILVDRVQQLVKPDSRILEVLGIDTRYAYLPIPASVWKADREGGLWVDAWGVQRRFTGLYFDMLGHPLEHVVETSDLPGLTWPDARKPEHYEELAAQVEALQESGYGIIVNLIGSCFEFAWYLRGFEKFLSDLVLNPGLACSILDIMLDFQTAQFAELLNRVGDQIDVVLVGDDLATQNGPFISPDIYRRLIKPRQKKLFDTIRGKTRAKLFYHSCGAVSPFIPDLIDIGVDILNPVQVAARGMDAAYLKREFGSYLCFWGGIDTQSVLPFGTPDDVRDEVRRRIDQLAPGGGYVLGAVHNIQADVPPENVVAMFEEALRYGGYGVG
ncbi:MAG TPA: uroporphyrinogen decarboxylase family protein [Atribacteraceae bacterium]|nr:uroporphyrinogen decarboxylase family protein [Atribacteraceae bacterium]